MIQRIEDYICGSASASVVHVVREVVEMEKVREKIVAYPKLRSASVRVAHRCE